MTESSPWRVTLEVESADQAERIRTTYPSGRATGQESSLMLYAASEDDADAAAAELAAHAGTSREAARIEWWDDVAEEWRAADDNATTPRANEPAEVGEPDQPPERPLLSKIVSALLDSPLP